MLNFDGLMKLKESKMFEMFYVVLFLSTGEFVAQPERMTFHECAMYGIQRSVEYHCMPVMYYDAVVKAKAKAIGEAA